MFKNRPKSKYGNKKVEYNGLTFDSQKEFKRYLFLVDLQQQGVIKNLTRQVKHELIPSVTHVETVQLKTKTKEVTRTDQLAITYTSDFEYDIVETGEHIYEDVKASKMMIPKEFTLKAKLFFWKYKKHIILVFNPKQPIS